MDRSGAKTVRMCELMGTLSFANDLGQGQPLEQAQRMGLLAVAMGRALGLPREAQREGFYASMLRTVGCSADAHGNGQLWGDELEVSTWMAEIDMGKPAKAFSAIVSRLGKGQPRRLAKLLRTLAAMPGMMGNITVHCELGRMLAVQLGLPDSVQAALEQMYERWDGKGIPGKRKREQIAVGARLSHIVGCIEIHHRLYGLDAARAVVQERSGGQLDPEMAECFEKSHTEIVKAVETPSIWSAMLEAEPAPPLCVEEARIEEALRAMAEYGDLRSHFRRGHSAAVAYLAETAAASLGVSRTDRLALRNAALLHDLGLCGVPSGIIDKPGPLSEAEWERMRLHAYYTERILERCAALADAREIASMAHERLDASGYHRRLSRAAISVLGRILAAADAYRSMTEPRSHRPARSPDEAAAELRKDVAAGKLEREAVDAVLTAAGQAPQRHARTVHPGGLSEREVEVLKYVARGLTNKEVAQKLNLSPRTVGNHLQSIFAKAGVTTRAGAALFAMQNDMLWDPVRD